MNAWCVQVWIKILNDFLISFNFRLVGQKWVCILWWWKWFGSGQGFIGEFFYYTGIFMCLDTLHSLSLGRTNYTQKWDVQCQFFALTQNDRLLILSLFFFSCASYITLISVLYLWFLTHSLSTIVLLEWILAHQ